MDHIRVGFIGVGGMGQHHLKAVQQLPGTEVVAVCDINAELAAAMGRQYRARPYSDHHDMLGKEELDALYVVVPPFAHTDAEIIAARRGIHLFVEKPVALNMDKAREVRAAVEEAGIITSVGYTLRYLGAASRLRQFLRDRTIAMVVATRWGGLPGMPWWGVMSRSGGQLVEQTTHQVDLVRYTTGKEITRVYADYALRVLKDREDLDIPDVYSLAMQLDDGAPFSLTTSCAMRQGAGDSTINYLLDGSRVELKGSSLRSLPEPRPELDGDHGMEMDIDRAFIDAIRLHDPSLIRSTYSDAVKTLAVTLAANRSASRGEPVEVPSD